MKVTNMDEYKFNFNTFICVNRFVDEAQLSWSPRTHFRNEALSNKR